MSEQNKTEAGSEFQFQPNSTRPDDSAFKKPWQMPGFPLVTYSLLALTVLFYVVQQVLVQRYGFDLLFLLLGKINDRILAGEFWRLLTPALLHDNLIHLMFNMYALSILGRQIEPFYGKWRFLLLYVIGALGGNVLSFVLSSYSSLGSSTAIFGLLAAEAVFIWQNREIFGKQSRGILMNLVFVLVLNLFIGILPGSNIDNWGHLGGLLAGFFFAFMAGPLLAFRQQEAGVRLEDNRTKQQIGLASVMVVVAFAVIAAIPFFTR
ncbi:MAG: rhomboid family intramembrane serine protease [Anaerolineaceae bacterium]